MNDDVNHLRLLTIGHYVGAGITALFACIPLIHVTIGLIFLLNPPELQGGEPFPAQAFGLMFALLGGAFVISGLALAACIFAAGRSLAARKRYLFCIIVAAVNCAFFPFGTVLGVLTILVLSRSTVKAMFQQQATLDAPPAGVSGPGVLWRDKTVDRRSDD
jgi:hypothetical protein